MQYCGYTEASTQRVQSDCVFGPVTWQPPATRARSVQMGMSGWPLQRREGLAQKSDAFGLTFPLEVVQNFHSSHLNGGVIGPGVVPSRRGSPHQNGHFWPWSTHGQCMLLSSPSGTAAVWATSREFWWDPWDHSQLVTDPQQHQQLRSPKTPK